MPDVLLDVRVTPSELPYTVRSVDDQVAERTVAFEAFVEQHSRPVGRLAYLLLGDHDAADDLLADAMLAVWRQWDAVQGSDRPLAYVRRMVANMAASRIRSRTRERRRMRLFHSDALEVDEGRDTTAIVDLRQALRQLPPRRRACVVLRYAFDLSETEVAQTLGITVGTVKSQTSKGAAQLRQVVGGTLTGEDGPLRGAADQGGSARQDTRDTQDSSTWERGRRRADDT